MKRPKIFFITILLLLPCTKGFADEKLTMAAIDSPPYYNANVLPGEKRGIAIDIASNAFKAVNTDVTIEFIPMARTVWAITTGKYPVMLGTPKWFASDNKEHLIESIDLLVIRFLLFYRKDRFPNGLSYKSLHELKKYTIGNVRGSSTISILKTAGLNMELVRKVELNFKKLYAGRVDLAVGVDLSGWDVLKKIYPNSINEFATIEKPFFSANVSAIFLKKQTDLIRKFRIGLGKILKDGTYNSIIKEYYGKDQALEDILPDSLHNLK
ncbi:MAG: transporter substrate-binding domain-containing protein [Desulfobacteraceae bacterium]|jgi:polar amino acid transport system substrate-binding protein